MSKTNWEQHTRDTIGESYWHKLDQEDKDFLVEASHMFDLGKKVNIDKILKSLKQGERR